MNRAEAKKRILQHWITEWAARTPYAIDNRRLTQPVPPFASVQITGLDSDQATIGAPGRRRYLRAGWIDVKLYDARDVGTKQLDDLAEIVVGIFEGKRIGGTAAHHGITTFATAIGEARNDREYPDLWCVLCRTSFEFHERR